MRPLIAMTTYGRDEKGAYHLPSQYVDAVVRAGGTPMLIPYTMGEPEESGNSEESGGPEQWLTRCDGLILVGGGDLDPATYGAVAHPTVYGVEPARDRAELALVAAAIERRTPTLAICRGSQLLNVARGGTLIQHVPDVFGETTPHRASPRGPIPHTVAVSPDSRLAAVLGVTQCTVASSHHQAVDRLGDGLRAAAHAPDGLIEALELADHPELIAVQWHPERTAADDPVQQRLFSWLVQLAAKRRE